jgi:hypothetical protein
MMQKVRGWWRERTRPTAEEAQQVRSDANAALLHQGAPSTDADRTEFFQLYQTMVASSEALVARRQAVNTFFLTANGLILTAAGLFVRGGGENSLKAGGVAILCIAGLILASAWRSLLVSFGQLNRGKFVVINSMENHLAASVYTAEWRALGEGKDHRLYRSFTEREIWVPILLGVIYLVSGVIGFIIWRRWWEPW